MPFIEAFSHICQYQQLKQDSSPQGVYGLASELGIIEKLIGGEVHLWTAKIVAQWARGEKK